MKRRNMWLGAAIAAVLTAGAAGIGPAGAAGGAIVAKGGIDFAPNEFLRSNQRFSPQRRTVRSGDTVTLRNQDEAGEPHTWTLMDFGPDWPNTVDELFACELCNEVAEQHFSETGPPVPVLDVGDPGFDEEGDSILLFGDESAQVQVSAPAGTNLFYICSFHPWMQGRLNVR